MKTYVYIAQSLDGFIAKKGGDITWLEEFPNPDGSDFGFSDFMKKIDALLMGRNTYEKVLTFGFWPYEKPVYVVSNTIKVVPENLEGKVFIVRGEIIEILESLESKGLKSIYVDGGKLIQSFLSEDLIDTMIITTMPVILGEGLPLFASIRKRIKVGFGRKPSFE